MVRVLLEHGADVNGSEELGPPLAAALLNHGDGEKLLEVLLEHSTNVNAANKGASTPQGPLGMSTAEITAAVLLPAIV